MADEMKQKKPQSEMDALRVKLDSLAERAKTDINFVNGLKSDTIGTLVAAGVEESAAQELESQWKSDDAEVEGHFVQCMDWTIWFICSYLTF